MENQKFNQLMESSNNVFEKITGIAQLNEAVKDIKINSATLDTFVVELVYNDIKWFLTYNSEGYGFLSNVDENNMLNEEFNEDEDSINDFDEDFQYIWKNKNKIFKENFNKFQSINFNQ